MSVLVTAVATPNDQTLCALKQHQCISLHILRSEIQNPVQWLIKVPSAAAPEIGLADLRPGEQLRPHHLPPRRQPAAARLDGVRAVRLWETRVL